MKYCVQNMQIMLLLDLKVSYQCEAELCSFNLNAVRKISPFNLNATVVRKGFIAMIDTIFKVNEF